MFLQDLISLQQAGSLLAPGGGLYQLQEDLDKPIIDKNRLVMDPASGTIAPPPPRRARAPALAVGVSPRVARPACVRHGCGPRFSPRRRGSLLPPAAAGRAAPLPRAVRRAGARVSLLPLGGCQCWPRRGAAGTRRASRRAPGSRGAPRRRYPPLPRRLLAGGSQRLGGPPAAGRAGGQTRLATPTGAAVATGRGRRRPPPAPAAAATNW